MSLSRFGRRGGFRAGFYDAHSEVNRLIDEMFGGLGRRPGDRRTHATEWAPSVDVLQKDGDLIVRVEMPGVRPEDVDVAVHNRVLSIFGERRSTKRRSTPATTLESCGMAHSGGA